MAGLSSQFAVGAKHLSSVDSKLAPIIAKHGLCTIEPHTDYYHQLVASIIGQQLSVKSAAKIRQRFLALFDNRYPTPEMIIETPLESLRGVGLSGQKVAYVKDLAEHITSSRLDVDRLPDLSNDDVITELTAVKGIGVWTAHMFLIFSLARLDVLASGDYGVRAAITKLYGLELLPSPVEVAELAEANHWHPYESLACWYLWRSLDNEPNSN